MDTIEKQNLLSALRAGIVSVNFYRNGTDKPIVTMSCTINDSVLSSYSISNEIDENEDGLRADCFRAWCIEKQGWRSFKLSAVESWNSQ